MADEQAVATRSLKPLGVGYLVWHCISKLAILVILMFTTLAYAGIYSVQGQLPQTVSLMGFDVSAWLFIGGSWAILALVTLAGISFAVSALTFQREHVRLTRAIILGRIMFALCVIDLLTSVVQGDSVSIITGSVSLVLTGSLALEVRRASRGIDQGAPQKSFVAEAIDEEPVRLESLSDAARSRFQGHIRLRNHHARLGRASSAVWHRDAHIAAACLWRSIRYVRACLVARDHVRGGLSHRRREIRKDGTQRLWKA